MQGSYTDLLKRTLIVVGVALVPVLVWYLFEVILIAFGAIIFAMLLWLGAEPFMRWLSMREGLALVLSGLVILLIVATVGVLLGTRVVGQLQDVIQRAGSAISELQAILASSELGKFVLDHVGGGGVSLTDTFANVLRVSSNLIESIVIAMISGIYIAAQPRIYRDGFVQLFPPRTHPLVLERLHAITDALRLWLIGQLIQMVLIGALATAAVWIIGVPSPGALGLIAGFGEFVPYIGPIVAAIPAILVALTKSWHTALWTVMAYIAINQIEGHLVIPLI
jgi:predicted PurR-regulated permease PerM